MANSGLGDGLFSAFINWLYTTGDISVPPDFHSRCEKIKGMIDNDISGVINTVLDYSISSASNAQYKIECSDNNLQKLLNTWLQKINLELKGVPTGLQELSKEYFKERWQGSSLCLLRIKGWETLTIDKNTIEVPTIMWYVNGSSVYVKRDADSNYKLGSDIYYLDKEHKVKVPEGNKEEIIMQKPFDRWFDQYATPYLIRKGVYKNWLTMKVLQEKSDEVISKILPYLFIIKKGTERLFIEGDISYDDPDLKKVVDGLKEQLESYKNQKSKTPTNATTFDTEYDHLIPDLRKILTEDLYKQGFRLILSGLGFVDMLEIASSRQESRINPKPFVAEINNGVEGFKSMLLDIVYKIIERNKEKHPKLFSNNNKLLIVNSPLKINVEQILDQLRSGYIYGASSITTYQEVLGLDPETEKERRQKELDEGLEDLFYPHLIQNREDIPDRIIPSKPKTTKKETEKQKEKETLPEHMQEAVTQEDLMYPHIINNQEEKGKDTFSPAKPKKEKEENEDQNKKKNTPETKTKTAELEEKQIAKCKKCGYEFDYLSVPEAGMGYIKCPKCEEVVTQEDLIDSSLIEDLETAPYKNLNELPKYIKKMTIGCQEVFMATFNSVYEDTGDEGKSFAIANSAARRCMKKQGYNYDKETKTWKKKE